MRIAAEAKNNAMGQRRRVSRTRAYLVTMSSPAVVDMSSDTSPVVAFQR
jgi:hypothetical protein